MLTPSKVTDMYSHDRRNNGSPNDIHLPIPETYEYITLNVKRDFPDLIKDLRWGDYTDGLNEITGVRIIRRK